MNFHIPRQESTLPPHKSTLMDKLSGWESLKITPLKKLADEKDLTHKQLLEGEFWRNIPAFSDIDSDTFLDHKWQLKNSVTKPAQLRDKFSNYLSDSHFKDIEDGFNKSPMSMRVSPYLLALIDWENIYNCPIRKQFIPFGSTLSEDHPKLEFDSLHEQQDSPVPGLTHRYPDKALFLPLDTCPVYCRFCTRSYSVGTDTAELSKVPFRVNYERWRQAFAYIASRPELEDIVISGGDSYILRPEQIETIGLTLLKMPNIRRIRFATKGLAIMPQKILTDYKWLDALSRVADYGRSMYKEVVVHTHFNHPREITWISREALRICHDRGINVRNQSVLLRGVNDDPHTMITLIRRLSYLKIQPYYVYLSDMVKGVEDLRTSVAAAVQLEKQVRGSTAGFNTPRFVCDTPGGGGKRSVHSYEHYNQESGIAIYTSPSVKQDKFLFYYDPLHSLSEEYRERWHNPVHHKYMIEKAINKAKNNLLR